METDMVSLKVDQSAVNAILEKQIQAAIVAQLGNQDELIGQAVKVALSQKVTSDGNLKSTYSSDLKYDYLELLATKSVHEAAREALKEWLDQNMDKVREAVFQELNKPDRVKSLATCFADAVEQSLSASWRMDCNISFREINK